jgi:hypothetical protein
MATQEQQFGLARIDGCQQEADFLPLFGGGANLFRSWRAANAREQGFLPGPASLTAQFVQSLAHGSPIQPASRFVAMRLRTAPELQEHFHGEFLGARGIAGDSGYHLGNAFVLIPKDGLNIEPSSADFDLCGCRASWIHTLTTTSEAEL